MVVQWEDRFYKSNRGHTYLGSPDHEEYHETKDESMIFPDFVTIAKGFRVPAERVTKMSELRGAIERMVNTPGPYLLDIMVPHQEHVLPMVPGGGTLKIQSRLATVERLLIWARRWTVCEIIFFFFYVFVFIQALLSTSIN